MLIVQKYGGSSVADAQHIMNVATRVMAAKNEGHQVIVVLSAQGDTTDELITKANELNPKASRREMDMLLSSGEQQSCALMAMALNHLGCSAISLNAFQVGIYTNSSHANARIKRIAKDRVLMELENNNVVVVTGFQGYNRHHNVTTLGRGGSDTTAVAVAAALHADKCEIYTDVEGVYTADPRIVPNAKKLKEISYDEMLELATLGAKVLHNRSVELAKKYHLELVVRSSLTKAEGTVVKEESGLEKMLVSGVAADKNVARIALIGLEDKPGIAFKVFALLSKEKIGVDIILQSIGRKDTKDISFTVAKTDMENALRVINENKARLTVTEVLCDEEVAKVSIVGAGMATNPGVAATMFEALFDEHININMIATSEIKISVLIDVKDTERAVRAIHDKFDLREE